MTVSVVWLAFGAAISEDRNGVVDADHVTRPEYAYRICFVLFCHQSHATPGDHGAMSHCPLSVRSPLKGGSLQAPLCPPSRPVQDDIRRTKTERGRVVVCQGRRRSKRDRPRAPTRQATTAHHHIRSPGCSVVRHQLSLTIVLPHLYQHGSRRGLLEVLFGRRIELFLDEQVRRRCT